MLNIEQAEKLTTARLLSYYKKNGASWLRTSFDEYYGRMNEREFNGTVDYWKKIRDILSERENVEPKKKK